MHIGSPLNHYATFERRGVLGLALTVSRDIHAASRIAPYSRSAKNENMHIYAELPLSQACARKPICLQEVFFYVVTDWKASPSRPTWLYVHCLSSCQRYPYICRGKQLVCPHPKSEKNLPHTMTPINRPPRYCRTSWYIASANTISEWFVLADIVGISGNEC